MKKLFAIMFVLVFALMLFASGAFAAGSCTQTPLLHGAGNLTVTLSCTGDAADGSVPTITIDSDTMNKIYNGTHFLYSVTAYPTSGGTAPDAADVMVNMAGEDLLGGKGANLIHATATKRTEPYNAFSTNYGVPAITSALTIGIANQATASANFTIVLDFER